MQKLYILIVLSLLSLALGGCEPATITATSPDTTAIVEMGLGDKVLFKVEGPANSAMTKCVWYVERTGSLNEKVLEKKNEYEFEANPSGEPINRFYIRCEVWQLSLVRPIDSPFPTLQWMLKDSCLWTVRIHQGTPPTWQGNYLIIDNTDVQLLSEYSRISGNLYIFNTDAGTTLAGLHNLTIVDDSVLISNVYNLANLSGLDNLSTVGADLYIRDSAGLTSLSGLNNLRSVRSLYIWNNKFLADLSALQNLTTLEGDLNINDNGFLTDLSGLKYITTVGGNLEIESNDTAWPYDTGIRALGMDSLCAVKGDFKIHGNTYLCTYLAEDLRDQVLSCQGIGGAVDISGNNNNCEAP